MSMMNPLAYIFLFVLTISGSHAQDTTVLSVQTSSLPTPSVATSSRPGTFQQSKSPSTASYRNLETSRKESWSIQPGENECVSDPGWFYLKTNSRILFCDDDEVECSNYGFEGPASKNCCKCKAHCSGQCTNVVTSSPTPYNEDIDDEGDGYFKYWGTAIAIILIVWVCCSTGLQACNEERQHDARLEANRETMVSRRQQQRQTNISQGSLTEEERNHARYELFLSKFHFQTVLPDKSNISADCLRNATANLDEENADDDDALVVPETKPNMSLSKRFSKASLSIRQLSSWRRTAKKDECCVCLESYNVGETICAAITKECDHVFHEGCMLQWFKNNDKCPLCRVDLIKE